MGITLSTTRAAIRTTFGPNAFVASFVRSVEAAPDCPTACINARGDLRYNPAFTDRYVTSKSDLFCLVVHELMHPLFGHFIHQSGPLENLGADMVINAVISQTFREASDEGSLFRHFYRETGLEGLLRPGSDMDQGRYAGLYGAFYKPEQTGKLSTGEAIRDLKALTTEEEATRPMLMGRHCGVGDAGGEGTGGETLSRIAADLRQAMQEADGHATGLSRLFVEVLRTHLGLKRTLLAGYTTRQKVDRFRALLRRPRISVTPVPLQPSKRDHVLLAAGVCPFHYHNRVQRDTSQERGLAVYLDVSGSVNRHLPHILGLLRSLDGELQSVYLFSNKVVEMPFHRLMSGRIETTHGTDFDCIAEHVLENGFDKAVVITDGYASMKDTHGEMLRERGLHTLTVLFGGRRHCSAFAQTGPVIELADIAGNG